MLALFSVPFGWRSKLWGHKKAKATTSRKFICPQGKEQLESKVPLLRGRRLPQTRPSVTFRTSRGVTPLAIDPSALLVYAALFWWLARVHFTKVDSQFSLSFPIARTSCQGPAKKKGDSPETYSYWSELLNARS